MERFFTRFAYLATRHYWLWLFVVVVIAAPVIMLVMIVDWPIKVLGGAWRGALRVMIDYSDELHRDIDLSRANYEIKKERYAKRFQERA